MSSKISRNDFIKTCSLTAVGLAVSSVTNVSANPVFDCVIKDGTIVDGTGGPLFKADIGITGDSIAAIGEISPEQGKETIQAEGLHISPGFIDIHSHSDFTLYAYPNAESRILQGVTTELTGNCGDSVTPITGAEEEEKRKEILEESGVPATWTDTASYYALIEKTRIALNHALLIGQGTLRRNAIGLADRKLTGDEMKSVLQALETEMDHGAFGLSTGLEYTPGVYTPAEEIIALAQIVSRYGGLYATHIRNESNGVLEAVHEAIEVGRQTGVRVEISHFKVAGKPNWHIQPESLHLLESARRDGFQVSADAYPYTAYSTGLAIVLDPWVKEGGTEAIIERLRDETLKNRIQKEIETAIHEDPGHYDLITITGLKGEKNRSVLGKNLSEIAGLWNLEPAEAFIRLMIEEETSVTIVGHGMKPENMEMVLSHPLVMIGSDGYSIAPRGKAAKSLPHPRSYGTFPRVLSYYGRERKLFDLATAVKKMTGMPADQIGLKDRGRIARGMKADLVIFNADSIRDTATFNDPHQFPIGIECVLVNGTVVAKEGKPTGALPGRVLQRA